MTTQRTVLSLGVCLAMALGSFGATEAKDATPSSSAMPERVSRVRAQMAARITQADREAAARRLAGKKQAVKAAREATHEGGTSKPKAEGRANGNGVRKTDLGTVEVQP